jgi:hypothetical protein
MLGENEAERKITHLFIKTGRSEKDKKRCGVCWSRVTDPVSKRQRLA